MTLSSVLAGVLLGWCFGIFGLSLRLPFLLFYQDVINHCPVDPKNPGSISNVVAISL